MIITVIIPIYNKAASIQRALDAVLAQTLQDFELIVIDDGSTDESAEIVWRCKDPRIRLIRQENAGVSAARNHGVEVARSKLVAFLDADDEWQPTFLETVLALFRRFPHAGAYATAYEIKEATGKIRRPAFRLVPDETDGGVIADYFKSALLCHPIWTSAVMIPKTVMDEVGGFPVDVRIGEDLDTWFRIALRYPMAWSPVSGAIYHQSYDSACKNKLYVGDVALARSYKADRASLSLTKDQQASIELLLALYRLYDYIIFNWLAGETRLARQLLFKCRLLTPFWRRWLLMFFVTHLPRSFTTAFLRLKELISGQHFVLPPTARVNRV